MRERKHEEIARALDGEFDGTAEVIEVAIDDDLGDEQLGHSSIKATELYLRYLTPEEQHRAKYGPAQKPSQV